MPARSRNSELNSRGISLHIFHPGSDMPCVVSLREHSAAPERLSQPEPEAKAPNEASRIAKEKALKALTSLPPFSPILNKLLATLADENISFSEVAALIEKDTVVAGNVLHLVNSALYARREAINSVGHALSVLGILKLRNAVLGMSLTKMWNQVRTPVSWSMARFNMHSAATAILSDILAQRTPVVYPEGAFVAGLMHDIGRLLIAIGLPAEANAVAERCPDDSCSFEYERQVLGFAHPELSADALRLWKLPEPIQAAVRDHHANIAANPGNEIPLCVVVSAANRYVNGKGIAISTRLAPPSLEPFASLGLGERQQQAILADFEAEYAGILPFFK